MSIVEKLTEGIVNRDMKREGAALLSKWESTGLLEGLQTEQDKSSMARLLENQAKELLRESSSMGGNDVEGFAAVAFPIVRRVFAGLIANDLVSVQPMSLPSGLIFFLDFTYSGELGTGSMTDRFGNTAGDSLYGTDRVGSQVTGGVNLVGSLGENLSGPRDAVGLAYGSPQTLQEVTASSITLGTNVGVPALSETQKSDIKFDPDVLAEDAANLLEIKIPEASLTNPDLDNLSAFNISGSSLGAIRNGGAGNINSTTTKLIRRLTKTDGTNISFFFLSESPDLLSFTKIAGLGKNVLVDHPTKDAAEANANAAAGSLNAYTMLLENTENIPEIDIKVDSIAITAQTKKLKAKWTPELGQDLNAYHNLDAEVELTSILSEQIALEIDREILADLVNGATAGTFYWSRSPGLFVDRSTGAELGATSAAPDFTGTVSEWYETLIETINDVSAQIHRKTLRGGANFVVVSPEVANILEFTAGFRANVTADAERGEIGAVKVGSLNRKFDVIVDPYFPRNVVLVGRKGSSFLESGYVYAPYVPLQTTPTIFGPEDFVPRKGVMTRYAKKMVRPDMYGLVICRGLLGESGS
tara:strand:+ start:2550 stop:4307 length:1758 start_codon:yes stop_codon:yes gene_type:complete